MPRAHILFTSSLRTLSLLPPSYPRHLVTACAADNMEKHEMNVVGSPDSHGFGVVQSTYIKPQARKLHDANITFEEYNYYAEKTREEEKHLESPKLNWRALWNRKTKNDAGPDANGVGPKQIDLNLAKEENRLAISDQEWTDASRAFRSASWGAIFYLVRIPSLMRSIQNSPLSRSPLTSSVHSLSHIRSAP